MTLRYAINQMTPAKIEAWLETLDTGYKLMCDDCRKCLFAQYLTEQISIPVHVGQIIAHHGGRVIEVPGGEFRYLKPEEELLPGWAVDVIVRFDGNGLKARSIASSLRILREVCPELKTA